MEIFVKKPILAIVLSVVILLSGLLAATKISVSQFPKIESTSLVISTQYSGVSAQTVQGFVTDPIERVAMTVPGVDFVDSTTIAGSSTVTAWLKLNQNSTDAMAELNSRLSQIKFELPEGAEDPAVTVSRVDRPGATFYLDVEAPDLSRAELTDFLSRKITPLLSGINGVQKVDLEGARNPAMRVWLDPIKMAAFNIGSNEVYDAMKSNNVVASLGRAKNNAHEIDFLSNATMKTVNDFEMMIIKKFDGGFIRLIDIARVEKGEDRGRVDARINQRQTIYLSVYPLPGANEIEIGDALYAQLEQINASLPQGIKINISFDGTLYMRDALQEIFTTLLETVVLVGIVILFLMGSFRSAIVPLVTIPISILGSIAVILTMGFSLNLLTILAIVLSVGLVVDDAIVVVENVARHMRQGKSRLAAALISSKELFSPIVAMTITLAVVYAPIGFVSGLTGALFKEFAFTLAIAVFISGIVAVTLSPVMSAFVLNEGGAESSFTKRVNQFFDRLGLMYAKVLKASFRYKVQIIFASIVLSSLMVPFYLYSAKELAPVEDQSSVYIVSDAPPASTLAYGTEYMSKAVDTLSQNQGIEAIWQIIRPGNAFSGINFVDFEQRDESVQSMLPALYGQLSQISGIKVFPVLPMPLPTAGQFDVELVVQSQDSYEEMLNYAYQLVGAAYETNMFLFVDTDLKVDRMLAHFEFNHQQMADLGLDVSNVVNQVSSLLSEQAVNRFDADGRAYRVIPMVEHKDRRFAEAALGLHIKLPSGELIQLSSIATLKERVGPRQMGKFNQQNAFRILGGVAPGVTAEQALKALEEQARHILPDEYALNYAGNSRQLRKQGNSFLATLGVAILVVYLVLAVQFNSFRSPLVILLGSVPLAISGAMSFSFFNLTSMNIYAQIGLITLVGLIAKNGILITEFANELLAQGKSKSEAIIEGAVVRLRPIMMTTAATVLGHFPLVLVTGAGAEARNSIGIILVAGMLIGTVFTLFVLPTVYMLLAKNVQQIKSENSQLLTAN
ncbi:efflux RND transporter permease subunit [Pseudoalteromonas luteoviolacea]|uniref:efflux RND transporter permease subunit n=1 Tax=Pseudoalteromonas luteoviolacea TaxID=43657 RepID=UPI001B375B80|nr:efflux RND transporter permease subunit [Pseudoalteromonas luteoviolacea]MBQ4836675.1 efflux RND transporter permease subunit [Pseudoalteromonas luteoviolacea]